MTRTRRDYGHGAAIAAVAVAATFAIFTLAERLQPGLPDCPHVDAVIAEVEATLRAPDPEGNIAAVQKPRLVRLLARRAECRAE